MRLDWCVLTCSRLAEVAMCLGRPCAGGCCRFSCWSVLPLVYFCSPRFVTMVPSLCWSLGNERTVVDVPCVDVYMTVVVA